MPTGSPQHPRVDLVVHIGTGKAGSTSLQAFFRANRDRLAGQGVLYPRSPGGARHLRLGLFLKPTEELVASPEWGRQKHSDPAQFRKSFRRRLFMEMAGSGLPRVLFSDEILFGSSVETLRRLGHFTHRIAQSTRLVAYLRRQDDHMVSRYQQGVKIGWVTRLRDWAREDMSDLYDYRARLALHEQLVAPDRIVVRRFEQGAFERGSLHEDFLHAAGLAAEGATFQHVTDRNLSLDAESVEFLRLLNLYRVAHEGGTPGLINNRSLVRRLAPSASGPTLTLDASLLDEFMRQWEEPNALVARDFLDDASEQLFRMPRKTRNTTTVQHLDPARLDHFFALGEIPEQIHAPLRRLAEREAKVR